MSDNVKDVAAAAAELQGSSSSMNLIFSSVIIGAFVVLFVVRKRIFGSTRKLDHEKLGLFPMKHLRQRVLRQPDGSTHVQPFQANLVGDINDQFIDYKSIPSHVEVTERGCKPLALAKTGISAAPALTVMEVFRRAVDQNRNNVCLVAASPDTRTWTWQEFYDDSLLVAKALVTFGFEHGDSTNIIGFNAPEYLIMEMGTIAAGGKAAGIYTTNSAESCHYVSEHSRAVVVAVQNEVQLKKFLQIRAQLPRLRAIVCWGIAPDALPKEEASEKGGAGANCEILSWSQFIARGRNADPAAESEVLARIQGAKAGEAVTLIYTSGTTGNPKAVMISNDNAIWTSRIIWSVIFGCASRIPKDENIRIVSYLPLSHIAAQMVDIFGPLYGAAFLGMNATVYFADDKALKGTLLQTLLRARPTQFFGVPRVWEKFMEAIVTKGASTTGLRRKLVDWAKRQGAAHFAAIQNSGKRSGLSSPLLFPLANVLLKKVRENMGLDKCRICLTGAAPINAEVLRFFGTLNIPVQELFGMSESTGPHSVSYILPFRNSNGLQVGSCGPCMPGVEMLILHDPKRDPKGHGEICMRGRHIMMGYMGDLAKSKDAIDENGWLHSGDIGSVDEDGMLTITGRIKELIITKGGENIAPVPVEEMIKGLLPSISNFVMIGDKRHFCSSLVTLKCKPNPDGTFTDELDTLALKVDPDCKTVEDARKSEKWRNYIQSGIDKYNTQMAVSHAQKIQKYTILSSDFSIPGGELGPTLKLKRGDVSKKYAEEIEAMYAGTAE